MADAAEFLIKIATQASGLAATQGALQQLETSLKSALPSAADATRGALRGLGGAATGLGDAVNTMANLPLMSAKQAMTAFGEAAGGMATDGAKKLSDALSSLGPEGAAAGAAIVMVTGVLAGLFETMTSVMGIAISVTEKIGQMRSVLDALGGGAQGGGAALKVIQDLGKSLPFAGSQIGTWAKSLMAAGFQGQALKDAIEAVAAAAALMPETGAAAAEKMLKQLKEGGKGAETMVKTVQQGGARAGRMLADMGLNAADLAKALGKTPEQFKKMKLSAEELQKAIEKALKQKGKGPLEDMALTFPVLIEKVRAGFLSIFAKLGPAVKPFMQAIKELFGHFGKGTPIMKFFQGVVTQVFGTLFGWATRAVHALTDVVKWLTNSGKSGGMFSGVVKAMKLGWAALVAIFGAVKSALAPILAQLKQLFSNALVLKGIKNVFTMIAGAILVVVVVLASLVAAAVTVIGVFTAVFAGVVGVVMWAVGKVFSLIAKIIASFRSLGSVNLRAAATHMASGFVMGIVAKISGVYAAARRMGLAAKNAIQSALGIASPSTVMMKAGVNTGEGFEKGVDQTQDKAAAAVGNLGAGRPGGKGGGKGGERVSFVNCVFGSVSKEQMRIWMTEILDEEAGGATEMEPA